MEVLHRKCAGLDVHKDSIVACARIGEGAKVERSVQEFGTSTSELVRLADWLEARGCTHVVMEATGVYWKPVWNMLAEQFELLLANAHEVKNVPGRKSDVNDAMWLADLLAHGLVRSSFVPPEPIQELRDLTRMRRQIVRNLSESTQRIQKILETCNIKLSSVATDILGKSGRAILRALIAGERDPVKLAELSQGLLRNKRAQLVEALRGRVTKHHRFLLAQQLRFVETFEAEIKMIDAQIDEQLAPFAETVERLQTIPGVGPTAARTLVAEIGFDMSRFPSAGHLKSWAGLCPRMDESAGKRRCTRIRKGNLWLKTILTQCAWAAIRTKGYLRAQFLQIKSRRDAKKALIAVAASILTAAYAILRDGSIYRDLGGGHFDLHDRKRKATRLVRRLRELGYEVEVKTAA